MKICLALNDKNFEEYIKKKLHEKDNSITFTTPALYADMVVTICKQDLPDILLLNEALPASKSKGSDSKHHMSFGEMIGWIRKNTNTRIILICSTRPAGDKFLRSIVNLGIYDIVSGDTVKVSEIIGCIFKPRNLADIKHLIEADEIDSIPDTKAVVPVKVTDEVVKNGINEAKPDKKKDKKGETEKNSLPEKVNIKNQTTIKKNNEKIIDNDKDSMVLTSDMMPEHFKKKEDLFLFEPASDTDILPFFSALPANFPAYGTGYATGFNMGYNGLNQGVSIGNYGLSSKLGRIFLFLNVREGDGVTTITTNTAFAAAISYPDKNVLLIDVMPNKTTLFDRLCIPKGGTRLDTMESNKNAGISKAQITGNNQEKYREYPENLVFLRTSSDFAHNGNMDIIRRNLGLLKNTYDYIFINATGKYYTDFLKSLTDASDSICYVITQDYENLVAINQGFDNKKSKIVLNRYVSGCKINKSYVSGNLALSGESIKTVAYDSNFVKYQNKGLPLYPYAKLKTRQSINSILYMLI